MDALDIAVLALRLALVLVLYAFLMTVLRLASRGLRPGSEAERQPLEAAAMRPARPAGRTAAGPPGGVLRLVVLEPARSSLAAGGVLEVHDGATFGRGQLASVVVADPTVSTQHARIQRQPDGWVVVDLGSTNGTLVNQRPVEGETRLAPGDVLGLGQVRLQVAPR